ncbi:DUF2334 domain-containing protein [Bacillaceae bacterium S4-13-56]
MWKNNLTIIYKGTSLNILPVFLLITLLFPLNSLAETPASFPAEDSNQKVVVVYSDDYTLGEDNLKQLDILLGHFSTNIQFIQDRNVRSEDLDDTSLLFYYGLQQGTVDSNFIKLVSSFDGTFVVIGHNISQFPTRSSFLEIGDPIWINQISDKSNETDKIMLSGRFSMNHIKNYSFDSKVLLTGWVGKEPYPLLIKNEQTYFYSSEFLDAPFSYLFTEKLFEIFDVPKKKEHLAYIRLEDIHPLSDPKLLKEIGHYLWEKEIPYLIAVIPVYTSPEINGEIHYKDKPEMVEVLKYLQDHGGTIILHGYSHKYRDTETGEGFEFWDVKNNHPIYNPFSQNFNLKERNDFDTYDEFQQYKEDLQKYEKNYTESKIEKGIQELVDLGLYPLGFEPPHYTMSQNGYKILSQYFSHFFGQVQLSDKDWEITYTSPLLTKPKMLNGMVLYPETIGFYDPGSVTSYMDIYEKLSLVTKTTNGFIGFFYHPYIGLDSLKPIVEQLEQVENIKWIDLKKQLVHVTTPYKSITTNTKGGISVSDQTPLQKKLIQNIDLSPFEMILWGIVSLVSITIIIFLTYTFYLRSGLRKSLFKERDASDG